MPLYRYLKNDFSSVPARVKKRKKLKYFSLTIVILGVILLGNAVYPIVYYQLFVSPRFARTLLTPDPQALLVQNFGFAPSGNNVNFALGDQVNLENLTQPIFTQDSNIQIVNQETTSYFLSIPKLKIEKAKVVVGVDLKNSLAQYPGTSLPGTLGNPVIFGHSVLPQFFNPKNYMTIFSTLPTLQPGDEILIDLNNIRYKYIVEKMIEVSPDDVSVLAQRYDDYYLTLVTCVPPGTYLKRLLVRARLVKY